MKPIAGALLLAGCSAPAPETAEQVSAAPPTGAATAVATADPSPAPRAAPVTQVDPASGAAAVEVVRGYLAALATGDRQAAARAWETDGGPAAMTPDAFELKFAAKGAIVGDAGRIDSGAGQRYVEVPIRVVERGAPDQPPQAMTVILHRTGDIDGASAADRRWHIRDIRPAES